MNIDEAIEILKVAERTKCNGDTYTTSELNAIETLINEYNNLKQIEEAHRIENGKLRERISELERKLAGLKQTFAIHDDTDNHIPHID